MKALLITSVAAILMIGCANPKTDAPAATAAPTVAAPTEAASSAVVADVPTPEDYEAKAEKTIAPTATPGELTQQLDALEKEIGQ